MLPAVPCCSGDNCNQEINTENSNDHSQDHNGTDRDGCSPYITCCACFEFPLSNTSHNFQPLTDFVVKKTILSRHNYVKNNFAEIWNPPKIS